MSNEAHKLPDGWTLLSAEVRQLCVSLNLDTWYSQCGTKYHSEYSRLCDSNLTCVCRRRLPHERDRVHMEERALTVCGSAAGVVQPAAVRPDRTDGVQREAQV